jgi:hypothetical protein
LPNEIEEDQAQWARVKRHFQKCADKVIKDTMYNARIATVNYYYKKIKGQNMSCDTRFAKKRSWGLFFLFFPHPVVVLEI